MECANEGCVIGGWEQLSLNLEPRLQPSKSLRLGQRLRSGNTAACHKKEDRKKEWVENPLPLDLVSGSLSHCYMGTLTCTCQPSLQQESKLSFSLLLLKHDSVQLLSSILLLSHDVKFSVPL